MRLNSPLESIAVGLAKLNQKLSVIENHRKSLGNYLLAGWFLLIRLTCALILLVQAQMVGMAFALFLVSCFFLIKPVLSSFHKFKAMKKGDQRLIQWIAVSIITSVASAILGVTSKEELVVASSQSYIMVAVQIALALLIIHGTRVMINRYKERRKKKLTK